MPKSIDKSDLISRRRGRPEGAVTLEVREAISMLQNGEESVALELPEGVSRENVASKASRLSKELGVKVSVFDTNDGGVALTLSNSKANPKK